MRGPVLELSDRLNSRVEYYLDPNPKSPTQQATPQDLSTRVRFDFAELSRDRYIKNGFYWAADTQGDWVNYMQQLVDTASDAQKIVAEELARR